MHAVFFGLKRAYQSTLRIAHPVLAEVELTPARFDLLYALRKRHRLLQRALQRILGVSRATVSRMLGSLEALGLVQRTRDECDRRCKRVDLTVRGREVIGAACRLVRRTCWAHRELEGALATGTRAERWLQVHAFGAAGALDELLKTLLSGLHDTGSLEYRWRDPSWWPRRDARPADAPSGAP